MNRDLTKGPVIRSMLLFAVPMILGDLLQQCYNIADTLIVGQFLGRNALAAVGSAFTLMTFLTSVILGLAWAAARCFPCGSASGTKPPCGKTCVRPFILSPSSLWL